MQNCNCAECEEQNRHIAKCLEEDKVDRLKDIEDIKRKKSEADKKRDSKIQDNAATAKDKCVQAEADQTAADLIANNAYDQEIAQYDKELSVVDEKYKKKAQKYEASRKYKRKNHGKNKGEGQVFHLNVCEYILYKIYLDGRKTERSGGSTIRC